MADEDGAFWGSVRIGRKFLPNASGDIVELRPLSRTIYTNNYVVTGRALRRLGVDAVFEHWEAQNPFDRPDFNATASSRYLSCAVKHPFSTVSLNFLRSREEFRSDPRVEMTRFMEKLEKVAPEALAAWLRPNFIRFRQIMREAIDPR